MEIVDGPALSTVLATDGPQSPVRVADMLGQVARALRAVHAAGIVHRDVKLSNLLVGPAGQLKLTDFGIARALDAPTSTATGARIGSPPYMAPGVQPPPTDTATPEPTDQRRHSGLVKRHPTPARKPHRQLSNQA